MKNKITVINLLLALLVIFIIGTWIYILKVGKFDFKELKFQNVSNKTNTEEPDQIQVNTIQESDVKVFFIDSGYSNSLADVTRKVKAAFTVEGALDEFFKGPTEAEKQVGLTGWDNAYFTTSEKCNNRYFEIIPAKFVVNLGETLKAPLVVKFCAEVTSLDSNQVNLLKAAIDKTVTSNSESFSYAVVLTKDGKCWGDTSDSKVCLSNVDISGTTTDTMETTAN